MINGIILGHKVLLQIKKFPHSVFYLYLFPLFNFIDTNVVVFISIVSIRIFIHWVAVYQTHVSVWFCLAAGSRRGDMHFKMLG